MQRHDARATADEQERPAERRLPDEVAADRPAHLEPVARDHDVVQERRDLAVLDPLDREVDLPGPLRLGRDRVASARPVAVLGGQPQVEVLARPVAGPVRQRRG